MILPIKKAILNVFLTLFICFTTYTTNYSFTFNNSLPFSSGIPNSIHVCNPTTHTHESYVIHHKNYDEYVESCINKETKDYIHAEYITYHEKTNISDLNSSSHDINTHDLTTSSHDLLSNSTLETRKQAIEENEIAQIKQHNKTFPTTQQILRELTIPKGTILYAKDIQGCTLDSSLMLEKVKTIDELINAFSSPIIKARFERIKFAIENRNIPKKGHVHPSENELLFLDTLISEQAIQYLNQIKHSDLNIAQSAFNELKQLWPWKREHTFLVPDVKYGTGEPGFIANIGIDIMKITEKSLITRPDYIAKYANPQEQKAIQEHREKCYLLQQKGNKNALFSDKQQLYSYVYTNAHKNNLTNNTCLAITENCWLDPLTKVLDEITHAPSLKKSCDHLKHLELQLLTQAQQQNIVQISHMRTWTIGQYHFDVLAAAHNCYTSRADYTYTPENQSYLSDTIKPILNNIKSKDLPRAHAELVHLKKQIDQALDERNITDPIERKEYIKKSFGRDVLGIADATYKTRLDHKKLVESFMAIDVNQAAISILENNTTYESVANEINNLAKHIFGNAYHCNLRNLPQIESHIYNSIDAMKIAQDHPTFIFNFSMVHHTLGDIQQLAHAIFSGTHPVLEKSSELLLRGLNKFTTALNPLTQASNISHLVCDLGILLKKSGAALWNDPINVLHNGITTTFTLTSLIRNAAAFTSDITVGKLYLSPEEYKQRTDAFCAAMEPLQNVTAGHCADFIGELLADLMFWKGIGIAYNVLKEIDLLSKIDKSTAFVTHTFKKGFDTHLANNPIVVTAEGITIKISDAMNNINNKSGSKNFINSSKALLENAYVEVAINLEEKIKQIRKFYTLNPQHDFANFGNKHIKIALEHILGIELKWSDEGILLKLSGFHHDFMGAVEKSNVFKFSNKIINENGCYSANIIIDSIEAKKTFFPQHWTQQEVADKIYEAYYNFRKSGTIAQEKGGKYLIDGLTNEGITIRMFITKKGEIVTAYPKLTV